MVVGATPEEEKRRRGGGGGGRERRWARRERRRERDQTTEEEEYFGGGGSARWERRRRTLGAEKAFEIFQIGQTENVDFLDFLDCVSADAENYRGRFRDENFRLRGDDDFYRGGFVVHVFIRVGARGVSGAEDAFVRRGGGRAVVGGKRVRGVDYASGRE